MRLVGRVDAISSSESGRADDDHHGAGSDSRGGSGRGGAELLLLFQFRGWVRRVRRRLRMRQGLDRALTLRPAAPRFMRCVRRGFG